MCAPIIIGAVVAAVSTGLQIHSANEQARAQQRANERATEWAYKQRQAENAQATVAQYQKTQEGTMTDYLTTLSAMESEGVMTSQAAETGLSGNYLKAISRNLDMQTSRQRGQDAASYRWGTEATNLQIGASDFRARKEVALLPEVPGTGAAIGAAVIGGISTGLSVGGAFKSDDPDVSLGGWGF